ncbi:hypothetical protein GMRT_12501 [Giardia muris]|uniref:Phosphatidylinositol-4-phosphate 5-kinase n=1 Tax=Giardia muris TaxID=5742 RepID=A0A4Z1T5Z3_GIAMU|nr:hypothetical protein GMRT_12501 [Giardia muris]|eukprot:TNJ27939.1 hypothetical protein GMRT_12501 [Giardia muris]
MPPKPPKEAPPPERLGDLPQQGSHKFIHQNGTIYEGEYSTFDGQFYRHGRGRLIENLCVRDPDACPGFDPVEPPPGACRAQIFDGFWDKDIFVKGRVIYPDGSEYLGEITPDGDYVDGGMYRFSCGSKWIGAFKGNEMHGPGYFVDTAGTVWKGEMKGNHAESLIRVLDFSPQEPDPLLEKNGVEENYDVNQDSA